ncbi:MAG: SDR family oxidoreductase [Opitutales bacterium]
MSSPTDLRQQNLGGRTVLILGGSSGIGLATAQLCDALGAQVHLASRCEKRRSEALETLGPEARGHFVDLDRLDTIDTLFADPALAALDHLVFLPPPAALGPIETLSLADTRAHFEHAFLAAFGCVQQALPKMPRAPESSFAFVTGALSRNPQPGTSAIVAAQWALEGFAMALAREVAPIRANVLVPGVVETPFWDNLPPANRETIYNDARQKALTGRIASAAEIADALVCLLANPFITATAHLTDGGWSQR